MNHYESKLIPCIHEGQRREWDLITNKYEIVKTAQNGWITLDDGRKLQGCMIDKTKKDAIKRLHGSIINRHKALTHQIKLENEKLLFLQDVCNNSDNE